MIIELRTESEATGSKTLSSLKREFKRTDGRFENGIYTMEIQL